MSRNYLISLVIFLLVAGWLASGWLASGEPDAQALAAGETEADRVEVPSVRGMRSEAVPHQIELRVRGRTEENRSVSVRSEISGKVASIPAPKGSRVEKGDELCRLEVDAREVNLEEARAAQRQADLEYKGALDLAERGLQSEINIAQARARLESANAAVHRATLALWNVAMRAPFAGIVERQAVEIGDFLNVGGECATVLEMDPLLLVGQVAERDIGLIEQGGPVTATLLTGESVSGAISFISSSADKITRSYRIEVEVPNPESRLRAGITSELIVPVRSAVAHRISPAVLVLDDDGALGIRAVDDRGIVTFHHIEIISEGTDGIWITGTRDHPLPRELAIITVGQETVFAGQRVRIELQPLTSLAERRVERAGG